MAANQFELRFQRLTPMEQARAAEFARAKGFRLTCLRPGVEELTVVPIEVVPAEGITRERFPEMSSAAIEGLRSYWTNPGSFDGGPYYPPIGFTPFVSENEGIAAALLTYMVKSDNKTIERWGYPIERLPEPPKFEPKPQPELRGLRGFFARFHS